MTTVNDKAPRRHNAALTRCPAPGHRAASMREAARIFLAEFPGLTGASLRRYSSAPVVAELVVVDELTLDGAR